MIGLFRRNSKGSAAVEFALMLPMMMALMFGSFEAGHFFWTEHKLVKAVRDGARYASRLSVDAVCPTSGAMSGAVRDSIRNVTATGQLSGGVPKVPGWSAASVDVTVGCNQFLGTGIYTDLGANGPLIRVSSGNVAYPSLFEALGFITSSIQLSAESSAAVTGI
jgi:Flp pilus assembly protein TadG